MNERKQERMLIGEKRKEGQRRQNCRENRTRSREGNKAERLFPKDESSKKVETIYWLLSPAHSGEPK